jgi:hypothetical protein
VKRPKYACEESNVSFAHGVLELRMVIATFDAKDVNWKAFCITDDVTCQTTECCIGQELEPVWRAKRARVYCSDSSACVIGPEFP